MPALEQFVEIRAGLGEIWHRLRKFKQRDALGGESLCGRLHLIRIEPHFAHPEPPAQIEQRAFDRVFEEKRIVWTGFENAMPYYSDFFRGLVEGGADGRSSVVLHLCLHAYPHA